MDDKSTGDVISNILQDEYSNLGGPRLSENSIKFLDALWEMLGSQRKISIKEASVKAGFDEVGDDEMFIPLSERLMAMGIIEGTSVFASKENSSNTYTVEGISTLDDLDDNLRKTLKEKIGGDSSEELTYEVYLSLCEEVFEKMLELRGLSKEDFDKPKIEALALDTSTTESEETEIIYEVDENGEEYPVEVEISESVTEEIGEEKIADLHEDEADEAIEEMTKLQLSVTNDEDDDNLDLNEASEEEIVEDNGVHATDQNEDNKTDTSIIDDGMDAVSLPPIHEEIDIEEVRISLKDRKQKEPAMLKESILNAKEGKVGGTLEPKDFDDLINEKEDLIKEDQTDDRESTVSPNSNLKKLLSNSDDVTFLGATRAKAKKYAVRLIGGVIAAIVIAYAGFKTNEIFFSTKKIEAHYETPAQDMRLVNISELENLKQQLENEKARSEILIKDTQSKIDAAVAEVARNTEKSAMERERISYEKGRADALGLSDALKERLALMSTNVAVVNGECEAFGRGNRIDKVYPINLPVEVLYWMIDPSSKKLSGLVAINKELLSRADGPVTQIRCYNGLADIWPSFDTPVVGADGHARPISENGVVQETNPLLR